MARFRDSLEIFGETEIASNGKRQQEFYLRIFEQAVARFRLDGLYDVYA